MVSPVFRQAPKSHVRSEVFCQQLLSGIPDEIILEKVTPKLSWRDLYTLSLVSPAWREANRSRQVYEARVRSHETETLAILSYSPCRDTIALALYSTNVFGGANRWELPPIPGFERGIPQWCECVTLDGKVYILGGLDSRCEGGKGKVYVMDLAGQRGWKRCASMNEARLGFGCCVKDGKIYVFGGLVNDGKIYVFGEILGSIPLTNSEVYDPKEDRWLPITPLPSHRHLHKVGLMGDELVVHGGDFYDPAQISHDSLFPKSADFLEFYNPVTDKWRMESAKRMNHCAGVLFIYHDNFHLLEDDRAGSLSVFHGEGHQWLSPNEALPYGENNERVREMLCYCAAMEESAFYCVSPWAAAALPLNDELLITANMDKEGGWCNIGTYLIGGKGFGKLK